MSTPILVLILFVASFTQSLVGFGSALIAMPLLANSLGLQIAGPLVALVVLVIELALLINYRTAINIRVVRWLIASSLVGVPLGIYFLGKVDEKLMLTILGVVILVYALCALTSFRLPALRHPIWALVFGLFAGLLGGAYNTSGPPVIIFGNCRRWDPPQFKANLQGFFLASSTWVAVSHAFRGNITSETWKLFLPSTLAIVLGIWAGLKFDQQIDSEAFRKVVLLLLIPLGVSLFL